MPSCIRQTLLASLLLGLCSAAPAYAASLEATPCEIQDQWSDLYGEDLVKAAKADSDGPKRFAPYLRLYLAGNPLSDDAKKAQLDALKAAGLRVEG